MKIFYSVEGEKFECEVSDGPLTCPNEQRAVAEECADDYHSQHDGWESRWPLEFSLHDPETEEVIAKLTVGIEHEPVFSASHIS